MELRHLRYFVVAAEELNFGRAATRLHVSAPAVSRLISGLEQDLDVALFERVSRGVRLTPAGESLFDDARRILGEIEQSCERARNVASGKKGVLRLAFNRTSAPHPAFREAIRLFHQAMPEIGLEISELSTAKQLEALTAGKMDLAFTYVRSRDIRKFEYREVERGDVMLVLANTHPLAKRRQIKLADLKAENFVVLRGATHLPSILLQACKAAGFTPNIVQQFDRQSAVFYAVSVGIGLTMAYEAQAADKPSTVVFRKLADLNEHMYLDLIWKKGNRSPSLQKFVALVWSKRKTADKRASRAAATA